jgi:hypothetical protein
LLGSFGTVIASGIFLDCPVMAGKTQLINFDNNRIVIIHTITTNYDWGELVYRAIRDGDIPKE